jgi:hypothetical protein
MEVIRGINKHLSMGLPVYLGAEPKANLFCYDNNVYGIESHRPMGDTVEVIVRGECKGIRNIETGHTYTVNMPMPKPGHRGDATTEIDEPLEYAFPVKLWPGQYMFFEIIR